MTDSERLYAQLALLSDAEIAAQVEAAQAEARAKEAHAYALLGHLNERRRAASLETTAQRKPTSFL